jgi:hypothetical protein
MAEQAGDLLVGTWSEIVGVGWPLWTSWLLGGCSAAGTVVLFWSQRRQIRQLQADLSAQQQATEPLHEVPKRIHTLAERIEELNERTVPAVTWTSVPESVHLNRRGQVLKLHRRGHNVSQIASDLNISQGEVRLTLKLNELLRSTSGQKDTESALISARIPDRNTRGLLVKGAGK